MFLTSPQQKVLQTFKEAVQNLTASKEQIKKLQSNVSNHKFTKPH